MHKKNIFLRFSLMTLGLIPFIIVAILFIPSVQKYLVENQLKPWLSEASVDSIHITPFSIQIRNLKLKYEAIDVHINHFDSELSPLSLFNQRIKIDKLMVDNIKIHDESQPAENKDDSNFSFYGLFPYFDTGFIYDIGLLDIHAQYNSSATGLVHVALTTQNFNENTKNPLELKITAEELPDIPDIQGILLDSSIILSQHSNQPINAHQSSFNLTLLNSDNSKQLISTQLDMEQLPKPNKWDSFPFDNNRSHYLQKRLHPEKIELKISHTNQGKSLSDIFFKGQYDGNTGVISGAFKLETDKELSKQFKSLSLPKIASDLNATFKYNTRIFEGFINLVDEFSIEDYAVLYTEKETNNKPASMPEQFTISNHIIASINEEKVVINSFLLNILSDGKDYINILTHKPLLINLKNIPAFLEQENGELLKFTISQLPLNWFNDFIPEYQFSNGYLDTDINLAIENKTLKLTSNRPLSLKNIMLEEHVENNKTQSVLLNQNIEADFLIAVNNQDLNIAFKQLKLYQTLNNKQQKNDADTEKRLQQIATSMTFNLKDPIHYYENAKDMLPPPLTIQTEGKINIHAITKIPHIAAILKQPANTDDTPDSTTKAPMTYLSLIQSLPKALSLDYKLDINSLTKNNYIDWNINQLIVNLLAGKNSSQSTQVFTLNNSQKIQLRQNKIQFEQSIFDLMSMGPLLSAQINKFNFDWLSPVMTQYAAPYKLSGQLDKLDLLLSSTKATAKKASRKTGTENNINNSSEIEPINFLIDINQLKLSNLESYDDKQLLFKNINIKTKIHSKYSQDKITINYPSFAITQNNNSLINNNGSISIKNPGNKKTQSINVTGKLNAYINRIMNLSIINHYTQDNKKLTLNSIVDSKYSLKISNEKLTINKSSLKIIHPESNGKLLLNVPKPISLSLLDNTHNFSHNGHLSFKLINFNITPYESLFPQLPISFDHINGQFDLIQTTKNQKIILQQPFNIQNIHFIDKEKALLNPFNITLDFTATQQKNITNGEIKQFSVDFIDNNTINNKNALELNTQFKLDLNNEIILSELVGNLDLVITQWLTQPVAIPDNTLSQGTLNTQFSLDKNKNITHHWLINNLVEKNGQQIVESISIAGTGKLKSLSNFDIDLPINMKSLSGESNVLIESKINLQKVHKKISMAINGNDVFLNDLLKLLATINPQSELSTLDKKEEETKKEKLSEQQQETQTTLNKTPAIDPFWKSGFDISAQLKIDNLYYTDYMSYQDIVGELYMDDKKLHAKELQIKFHESPMMLDALFEFEKTNTKPYKINVSSSLAQFKIGEFLKELNPKHVPRAEGVFDIDINLHGGLTNLSQIRNELLFSIVIKGKDGVYHLIPANDVMMRSSGTAMAVVGEFVSVLPTSGFGLGIVNRVIRFTKDIQYDYITMHLTRQTDLNTTINEFQIISPELRLFATGGLTFAEDTRLFDQQMDMTAQLNLAGEGAAIFYGLGLLKDDQDQFGFWKGPTIKFSGTLNHQNDNFSEIIDKAKSGTVLGGVTNPFSGLIGNFSYRWFGDKPDYGQLDHNTNNTENETDSALPSSQEADKVPTATHELEKQTIINDKTTGSSFFDDTF